MKSEIIIARESGGSRPGWIGIQINDSENKTFIRIKVSPENFGNAITGLRSECDYQIYQETKTSDKKFKMDNQSCKCWHTVKIDIPDWEVIDKKPEIYSPGKQYQKCVKCKRILEVVK